MKKLFILLFGVTTLVLSGCGTSKTLKHLGWTKGCPLERFNWMEVSEGYDSKTMLEIATKLEAAVDADLSELNDKGKTKGNFSSTLNAIIENSKSGNGKILVSQDFFQYYVNKRSGICAIYQGIKTDIFTDEDAKKEAQKLYMELAKGFSEIKTEEEKKNQ